MRSSTVRLLVVDDDARVRSALVQTIAFEADLVMAGDAADAPAALALAQSARPSVALVDLLLPDAATGLALVRRLALARRFGCPVVAMSMHGGLRQSALAAGALAFVEKSSDIEAILNTVRLAAADHYV
jgi:DNA-binding NarL/FixJ family response regulator